jgi:hypothetical protein
MFVTPTEVLLPIWISEFARTDPVSARTLKAAIRRAVKQGFAEEHLSIAGRLSRLLRGNPDKSSFWK